MMKIEATWKDWAGATQRETLNSPPVFKPEHVLFPLADGSYRAEANAQVRNLRWTVVEPEPKAMSQGGIQS